VGFQDRRRVVDGKGGAAGTARLTLTGRVELKERHPIVVFRYGGPIVWFKTAGEEMLTGGISVTLSWGSRVRPGNLVAFEHVVTYFRARL